MRREIIISTIAITFCLLVAGIGADDQPQKKVMDFLAVMDLRCGEGIKKEQCAALTDVVIDELVKIKKYTVIDRANRDKILSEAGFQQTACVNESCTIEMGRQLGVGKLVVGSITQLGTTYLVNLQLLNVETAAVDISATEECKCDLDGLIGAMRNAARKLMGETPVTPTSLSPQANNPNENDEYRKAYKLYEGGNCYEAQVAFMNFLTRFPKSELADNALFWMGECFYQKNDWVNAAKTYARVFKEYPKGDKVPDAYYKLGLSFWHLGKKEAAVACFEKVVENYPSSDVAPLAERKIKEIKGEL